MVAVTAVVDEDVQVAEGVGGKGLPEVFDQFGIKIADFGTIECGLKGEAIGGAMITPRHANIMINQGGATAADVRALIARVQEIVLERTGYRLEPEISFVGEF